MITCDNRRESKNGILNRAFEDDKAPLTTRPKLRRSITFDSSSGYGTKGNETIDAKFFENVLKVKEASKELSTFKIDIAYDEDLKDLKEGNKRLRWNLVFNVLLLSIIPLPLWLPFVSMDLAVSVLAVVQVVFMVCWLTVTLLSWITYFKLWRTKRRQFQVNSTQEHLVVIPVYKEPLALLITTIESIEVQESASATINLNISFEERSPDVNKKISALEKRFSHKFQRLFFTIHPHNLPGEIPGKCSNENHGMRSCVGQLDRLGLDTDTLIITTCDADTREDIIRVLDILHLHYNNQKYFGFGGNLEWVSKSSSISKY